MTGAVSIEKLRRDHAVGSFDCGKESLNRFLIRNALQSQQANASQTYVLTMEGHVAGYRTLVIGEVAYADAPERLKKGLARHPVPVMLARASRGRERLPGPGHRTGAAQGRPPSNATGRRHCRHPRLHGAREA